MSDFADIFAGHAVPPLVDHFAEPDAVTYQPAGGGTATKVDAIIGPESLVRRRDRNGALELVRQRSVLINQAGLDPSQVQANGTVIVADKTYAIIYVGLPSNGMYELELEAQAKGEITREGYRR